jgi:Sel1 repeat
MEKILVHCPFCSVKIRVSTHVLGKNRSCPKCKERFFVQLEQSLSIQMDEENQKTPISDSNWKPISEEMLGELKPTISGSSNENAFAVEFSADSEKVNSKMPEIVVNQTSRKVSKRSGFIKKTVDIILFLISLLVVGIIVLSKSIYHSKMLRTVCSSVKNKLSSPDQAFNKKRAINFLFSSALVLFMFYSLTDGDNKKNKEKASSTVIKKKVVAKPKPAIKVPYKKKVVSKSTGFTVGGSNKSYGKKKTLPVKTVSAATAYSNGKKYQYGTGVKKNYSTAAYWYQKAANAGHKEAQHKIGYFCEEGLGVAKNMKMAMYWYEKAAKQGNLNSQYNLALIYNSKKYYKSAAYWYRKAADQGDAEALTNLGILYYDGDLGDRNIPNAMRLFRLAAKKGDKSAISILRKIKVDVRNKIATSIISSAFSGFLNSNSGGSSSSGFDVRNQDDAAWLSRNYQRMHGTHK